MPDDPRTRQLWRAVAGRYGGDVPERPGDALRALKDAGASRQEIAQIKKDLAATLGVSVRQVQRMTTETGRERRGIAKHADRMRDHLRRDPRVRKASTSSRRAARMRNRGARIRVSGKQGPVVAGSPDTWRKREVDRHLDGEAMAAVHAAWEDGDDERAMEALREALEDEGYPAWGWDEDAVVEFLAERRGE